MVDGDLIIKQNLGVKYFYNDSCWMTSSIWTMILKDWDEDLRKNSPKRKILLLVDNFSGHDVNLSLLPELTNIVLHFLPANTTSYLQPLDAGIIKVCKTLYRCKLVSSWLIQLETIGESGVPKTELYDAIMMLKESWNEISKETIQNCFAHTGLFPEAYERRLRDIPPPDIKTLVSNLVSMIEQIRISSDEKMSVDDYINVDNGLSTIQGESAEVKTTVSDVISNVHFYQQMYNVYDKFEMGEVSSNDELEDSGSDWTVDD